MYNTNMTQEPASNQLAGSKQNSAPKRSHFNMLYISSTLLDQPWINCSFQRYYFSPTPLAYVDLLPLYRMRILPTPHWWISKSPTSTMEPRTLRILHQRFRHFLQLLHPVLGWMASF